MSLGEKIGINSLASSFKIIASWIVIHDSAYKGLRWMFKNAFRVSLNYSSIYQTLRKQCAVGGDGLWSPESSSRTCASAPFQLCRRGEVHALTHPPRLSNGRINPPTRAVGRIKQEPDCECTCPSAWPVGGALKRWFKNHSGRRVTGRAS